MRRAAVGLVTAMVVALLAGCGAVNKGSAFADEFQPFLDTRENVQDSSISASNNLPWAGTAGVSVTLVDGLSDDEVVREVWEITAHEVDNHIAYSLQVNVMAENADGGPALTGFELRVPGPAPDDDELRADIAEQLDRAQALVALGTGETSVDAFSSIVSVSTQSDALGFVAAACADDQFVDLVEHLSVEGVPPSGRSSRVVMNAATDCDWLVDARQVLDALDAVGPVPAYEVTRGVQMTQPRLRVSVAGAVGLDLTGAETLASQLGVTLEIVSV